jgi:hypothetical protein
MLTVDRGYDEKVITYYGIPMNLTTICGDAIIDRNADVTAPKRRSVGDGT